MQTKQNTIYNIIVPILIFIILVLCQSLNLNFYIISGMLMGFTALVFFLGHEGRKVEPRELIILGLLCLIAAGGRIVFQVIPFVSMLVGFVIIIGISFGSYAGLLCGMVSTFISNFICGHGPWTPWQMFAFGLAGFVAGNIYYRKKKLNKYSLTLVSFLIVLVVVSPVLDLSSMFDFHEGYIFHVSKYISLLKAGFIASLIHGSSVAICVFFFAGPILDKLERTKLKYGMVSSYEI